MTAIGPHFYRDITSTPAALVCLSDARVATPVGRVAAWEGASSRDGHRWIQAGLVQEATGPAEAYVEIQNQNGYQLRKLGPAGTCATVRMRVQGRVYRVTLNGRPLPGAVEITDAQTLACGESFGPGNHYLDTITPL